MIINRKMGVNMLKKFLMVILVIMIGISSSEYTITLAERDIDLFNEVLNTAQGTVLEYGVKATFETNSDSEEYCLELLKELGIKGGNVNITKDKNSYSVDFNNDSINGYIESMRYDNHNVVTLNMAKTDMENGLSKLKKKVEEAIGREKTEVKYFQYLKAQIVNTNKAEVNRDIAEVLKKHNAVNIDTIQIDNGYSTVAYTKKYSTIKSNGKTIDFNFAVGSYSSGSYIIIGTPVIVTTY